MRRTGIRLRGHRPSRETAQRPAPWTQRALLAKGESRRYPHPASAVVPSPGPLTHRRAWTAKPAPAAATDVHQERRPQPTCYGRRVLPKPTGPPSQFDGICQRQALSAGSDLNRTRQTAPPFPKRSSQPRTSQTLLTAFTRPPAAPRATSSATFDGKTSARCRRPGRILPSIEAAADVRDSTWCAVFAVKRPEPPQIRRAQCPKTGLSKATTLKQHERAPGEAPNRGNAPRMKRRGRGFASSVPRPPAACPPVSPCRRRSV